MLTRTTHITELEVFFCCVLIVQRAAQGSCAELAIGRFDLKTRSKNKPGQIVQIMDGGTIKTPVPNVVFTGVFAWGGVAMYVVGSESGQKQSVKLLQNMVCNTTHHPPPPTGTHCLYILYCTFTLRRGGGVGEVREKVDGQQFTRGSKVPT
jgi:hypothetical protein